MNFIKAALKYFLRRNIVILLLAANVVAFSFTSGFFSYVNNDDTAEKKDLVSKMNTGWQMLDWSFSLIDYFRNVGDRND